MLRRDQYKQAALKAKHAGDMPTATHNVKVAKVNINTKALDNSYNFRCRGIIKTLVNFYNALCKCTST